MKAAGVFYVGLMTGWLWLTVHWNRLALREPHTEGEVMMADFSFLTLCSFIVMGVVLLLTGEMF